ncbi:MAG: glutathione S-transferase family protein [Pseudomonadales bacterium]|nr:glutathione S-transferase family protein [Pseudomonadales bacterium]
MSLKLHGVSLSPFVRKVRMVLAIKKLDYEFVMAIPKRLPEHYEKLNPLGRIPALEHNDLVLADSAVICHYLEQVFPDKPLIPSDPFLKARCEWFEKFADYELAQHMTFGLFRNRIARILRDESPVQAEIDAVDIALPPLLDYLEQQLDGHCFLIGDTLTLADLALLSQCINFGYGGGSIDHERYPLLFEWQQRIQQQSFYQSLIDEDKPLLEMALSKANDAGYKA